MGNLNIDQLIEAASKKLGVPPDKLRTSLNSGNLDAVMTSLSKSDREKIETVLKNPKLSESFKKRYMNDKK